MAGEINTEVRDDPPACRQMADWFRGLAAGVQSSGDAVYRQRGESESFWQGTAGDACRAELTNHGGDGDQLEQVIGQVQHALTSFADRIDTVRARMTQAREVAGQAGLIVAPTAILPPGPGPGPEPTHRTGPMEPEQEAQYADQVTAYRAALQEFQAKQDAFAEVANTVADARAQQEEAHHALDKAMIDPLATIKTLKSRTMLVASTWLSSLKARQTAANDLFEEAGNIEQHGQRMQEIAADPRNSAATRATAERAAETSKAGADVTRAQGEKIQVKAPQWLQTGVEANPGNYIKSGTGWLKLGRNAARGVPFLGTGLAIGSGLWDFAMGKDPGVAAAETVGNIGGGVVGGMAGAEVGAAVGTVFPGPGNVIGGVVGGVVGGVIGSLGATQSADQAMGVEQ